MKRPVAGAVALAARVEALRAAGVFFGLGAAGAWLAGTGLAADVSFAVFGFAVRRAFAGGLAGGFSVPSAESGACGGVRVGMLSR